MAMLIKDAEAVRNPYLIFDMDGVLVDSNQLINQVSIKYLQKRGLPPDHDFNLRRRTMNLYQVADAIRTLADPDEPIEETFAELTAYTEQIYTTDCLPKPGVVDFLKARRAAGVTMCVASASEEAMIRIALQRLDMLRYFAFIATVTLVGGVGKDQPDLFLAAAHRMGAEDMARVSVFDDSFLALRSAKAAGMKAVAVRDPAGRNELPQTQALCDVYIDSFEDLL